MFTNALFPEKVSNGSTAFNAIPKRIKKRRHFSTTEIRMFIECCLRTLGFQKVREFFLHP